MPADPEACLNQARRIVLLAGPGQEEEAASLALRRELVILPRLPLASLADQDDTPEERVDVSRIQAGAAVAAAQAISAFQAALTLRGLLPALVSFSLSDLGSRGRNLHIRNTLFQLLQQKAAPLVLLNRAAAGDEAEPGRTVELAVLLAPLLRADLLLALSRGFPPAEIKTLKKAAQAGVPVTIKDQGIFIPAGPVLFDPNLWEALTLASRGGFIVSDSFARSLARGPRALALEDIAAVRGRFDPGSQVNIMDQEGNVLAVGLTNYSSARLKTLKSLKPDDIRPELGYNYYCHVIREENITLPRGEGGPACLLPAEKIPHG